jgi:hypothetical protein
MDCFRLRSLSYGGQVASLAMTKKHAFAISRLDTPEVCQKRPALYKQRAQGMPGARCTRGLVCNVHRRVRTRAYRAAESIRHSLRNGFTAYSALSPVNGFLATVAGGIAPTNLTPAPRRQDHTSSPYASAPFVIGTFASTASHPASVTIAIRPSEWDGMHVM